MLLFFVSNIRGHFIFSRFGLSMTIFKFLLRLIFAMKPEIWQNPLARSSPYQYANNYYDIPNSFRVMCKIIKIFTTV